MQLLTSLVSCLLLLDGTCAINPIISEAGDLADPSVLEYNGTLYLYPTGDQTSFRVYHRHTSAPVNEWVKGPVVLSPRGFCALAHLPGLGAGKLAWAPHIYHDTSTGKFYLYYAVCLETRVAVADHPLGPFVEQDGRLVNWAIDSFVFRDEATQNLYLYWSSVQLQHYFNGEERIYGQRLDTPTSLAKDEQPVRLIKPDQAWEFNHSNFFTPAGINEAPWVHVHNGTYYLMYSGAGANTAAYRIGYATALSPLGPYTKFAENPIILPSDPTSVGVYGPGHHSLWKDSAGHIWAFYHQQKGSGIGWHRDLCMDELTISPSGTMELQVTRGSETLIL